MIAAPTDMAALGTGHPSGSRQEGWQDDTILLVLTYSKLEHYLPEIRANLEQFWPNRPTTIFVTDGAAEGEDVLRFEGVSFVELLSNAVTAVQERHPEAGYVFVLLEDLCPLGPVDEAKLALAQRVIRESKNKFLAHIWVRHPLAPWKTGEWDLSETLEHEGVTLIPMDRSSEEYNCLVACFWDIDHLQDVISEKLDQGATDPWSFELPLTSKQPSHYLLEGAWPTSVHGFYEKGELNVESLTSKDFPNSPLMSKLRKDYCGYDSYALASLKSKKDRVGAKWKKRINKWASAPVSDHGHQAPESQK